MHAGSQTFTSKDSKVWLLSDNASCVDSGLKIISHVVILEHFSPFASILLEDFDLNLEALPFHVPKYFFLGGGRYYCRVMTFAKLCMHFYKLRPLDKNAVAPI